MKRSPREGPRYSGVGDLGTSGKEDLEDCCSMLWPETDPGEVPSCSGVVGGQGTERRL
jgi:hypothetical protein